ncbi:LysR family transcriptional regulator [Amphritea spongicola]|nr:LysR substrate-binding domain-containing protein [Aliamphritea spongicola]MBN3563162.1 LysR family transcriptional regulator [Aliamphritea spongicola]
MPALHSLLVFEAAARHMNFTLAAEELHVSQAAVSKQIKYLETYFGFALFHREGRKVCLSAKGEQLHARVSASLNYLADGVDELQDSVEVESISIAANSAVSQFWLNGVISEFYRAHPETALNVRLISSDHTPDLFRDDIDLSIAYDPGQRIGWNLTELFAEVLFPVASPEYMARSMCEVGEVTGLLNYELLDFERLEPNWINWKVWFSAFDRHITVRNARRFSNYMVLVDAARRGQGVALGTAQLMDQQLADGSLQRVGELEVTSGRSYWLGINENRAGQPGLQSFYYWLLGRGSAT